MFCRGKNILSRLVRGKYSFVATVRKISYKKGAKQRGIVERVFGMKYR